MGAKAARNAVLIHRCPIIGLCLQYIIGKPHMNIENWVQTFGVFVDFEMYNLRASGLRISDMSITILVAGTVKGFYNFLFLMSRY